jgi:sirohydrochlorin ferrochelatase
VRAPQRLVVLLIAAPLYAHVVSMSTGELRVDGPLADYELRMPMYEVAHVANPEALLDHIRFEGAQRRWSKCHEESGTYVCDAHYEFARRFDRVKVECTFYQVTVPNHVHVLHAVAGSNVDQAVFDQAMPRAELRFRPPSRFEILSREMLAGTWRLIVSPAALFLLVIMLAARTASEGALLMVVYLAGQWAMRPLAPKIPLQFSPRFIEAAMALTVAYLALEVLVLPKAGNRWAVLLVLGLFHGLYFAAFPATYLAGAQFFEAVTLTLTIAMVVKWMSLRARRMGAALLLAAGVAWFTLRVI